MVRNAEVQRRTASRLESDRLRAELQESLRDVLDKPGESAEHRLTCDWVIRACIERLGEDGLCESHLDSLVGLAELACRGYRASAPSPGQLYLERLLFHLLRSIALRGSLEACLAFADHLYQSLECYRPQSLVEGSLLKDYEAVAKNGFSVVWKSGERAREGTCRTALSLRLRALRFLALAERVSLKDPERGALLPSSSFVSKKFAVACALYEKDSPSLSREEAADLCQEFDSVLLQAVAGGRGCSQQLCLCQLAQQCCTTLCRVGHPSRALDTLRRTRDLLKKEPSQPRLVHFASALSLCRVACDLGLSKNPSKFQAAEHLAKATQILRSLPEGDAYERKAVSDSCQYLLSALDGVKGSGLLLGIEELLQLSDFLDVYLQVFQKCGEKEMSSPPGQAVILKQCYQNLELFTRGVYDFLLESQVQSRQLSTLQNSTGCEQLLAPCKSIVKKMVKVEEVLIGHGQMEYVGATALRLYNLAYGFYSCKLFSQAAEVAVMLRGDVQPPNLFARSSLPLDRVPKYFRLLVECYRKTGKLELAMETVSMWLIALGDQRVEQVTEPVVLWVCIKADAVKSGNEDLQLRTLQDALQPWELEPSAMAVLLVEELRAYKRLRTDTSQERFNVICDLIKLSSSQEGSEMQHMRAVQLVELAQVLCYRDFSQHAECSAMDCVEEALNVLGSLPETPDNRHQLQDDQAQAFLWLYVCDLESKVRTSVEGCRRAATVPDNLSGLEDGETNDLDYEDRQQGAVSVHDCINFNLTAESQRCKPMDKALSLWKSILSETPVPRLRCSEQTVHSLHLMAVLYRLMDKPFQAIESYCLSLRLLDAQSDSLSVVNVLLQLGEVMLLLDCLGPVQAYLDEAEQLLKTADPSKGDYLLMKMTCSVLRSKLLWASRQVPEGLALLLEVLKCPSLQKSSKVWYLLKAKAQQLVAYYLSLPPSALSAHLRRQLQDQGWRSPESALTDSHKVLCGIVMLMCPGVLMFGKSNPEMSCPTNPGDNLFQKWLVLAHLLTCSRRLVSLLSTMGSAQEAKMFCLETLRLTAKLHCVRPCAEFLVASAELELQRGDPGACNLDLEQVLLLLESCTDFGSEIRVKGGGRIQPRKGRATERSQEGSREGQREGEETPDFLRFRPLAQVNAVDGGDRWAQTASPVLKPKPRKCPAFLSHTTECPCPVCSDLPLSAICLRWALACSQLDGVTGESGQLLATVRERCRAQGARFEAILQNLALRVLKEAPESDSWAPVSGESGSQALVAPLRAIIAQTYSQSAWLSLGSDPFAQTWQLLEGGLKWLSCWSPGLQELEHSRAALLLTRAVAMIGQLASSRRCEVASIFPVWGWQHKKTQGGGPGVKGQSSSSLRRAAGGTGRKPGVAAEKTPMGPSVHTPARAGSNKPRAVSRAQRFEVLEEEPTPAWTEQALPAVRVSARVRSRLKKQFDDSDVEEGASEPADGEQHWPATRRGTTKPRRQNRSAAPAPRKVLAQSERPEEAGRRAKHRSRARRRGEEETETERGIEVFCTSDMEQEEPGSRRAAARNVPECEVLRRCDSTLNTKTALPPVERKGSWPHYEQQQPTVLTSSAGVAELDAVISCLSDACSSVRHCPSSVLYCQACHLLALCLGHRNPYTTAYLLNESLAITARHQMIQCLHRKCHKNRKERSRDVTERLQELTLSPDTDPQFHYLAELGSLFRFSTTDPARWPQENGEMLKEQLQQVPDGVVICLLTLSAVPLRDTGELLLLSRLEKGRVPVMVQILAEQGRVSVSSLLGEFDAILKQQKEISNVTELKAWWDGRMALDQRMKQVVESLETEILGCWRGLLLPGSLDPRLELEAAALGRFLVDGDCKNVEKELIEGALRASHLLTLRDVRSLADCLCRDSPSEARSQLEGAVHRLKTLTDQSSGQSSQLILILDKHLQRLPWESMPMLRSHRVSRLPSFQFLLSYLVSRKHQLSSVLTEGVNPNSVFYVLNPQGNLPNTEKTFKDWFRRKDGWEGVVGCGPSEEQLRSMLCNRDLYLYAGHGAGVRFLEGQEIQKLSCRAASLLVGCSSATLALRGNLEGAGIVLKYMMAGCPLFVGNLWDVTDKDIDRYMEYLLRSWLEAGPQASILDYISLARQAPKLKYLIGASPVAYGLSITLR